MNIEYQIRKEYFKKRWKKDSKKINEKKRQNAIELRLICINGYCKNNPKCSCCRETIMEFLTIDHVEGREKFKHKYRFTGMKLYKWLIENNFPKGFQVLCWNCNWAKFKKGICPHKTKNTQ